LHFASLKQKALYHRKISWSNLNIADKEVVMRNIYLLKYSKTLWIVFITFSNKLFNLNIFEKN